MGQDDNEVNQEEAVPAKAKLSEDWWAVIIAFVLFLLSVLGVLGENGIMINY